MNRIVISTEGELQELRENRVPKNTRQSTQFAVNLFQTWREQHAKLVEIRRKDGLPYHPESVKSICFGINRYLIEQDATMNMISAPEFLTCRQKVDGYIKKVQSEMQSPQSRSATNIDRKAQQEMWESGLLGPCMVILSISPQNSIKRSAKKCVTQ